MDQRQPNFLATWPRVQRAKSPTDAFLGSLGHQNWEPIVIGSHRPAFIPRTNSQAISNKIADSEVAGKLKQLSVGSRQHIVVMRAANKWSQVDLNQRCSFPVHTIKEIEAGRLSPTIGQLNTLNRVLKTGLKFA